MHHLTVALMCSTVVLLMVGIHLEQSRPVCRRFVNIQQVPFESGDILLFHSSVLLSALLGSSWTHVGLVIRNKEGELYLWEIRPPYTFPIQTPLYLALEDRVKTQTIAWRAIHTPVDIDSKALLHVQYNYHSWSDVLQSWLPAPWIVPLPKSRLRMSACCVDLVRDTLVHAGVAVPKHVVTPGDFDSKHTTLWETERQLVHTNTHSARLLRHQF